MGSLGTCFPGGALVDGHPHLGQGTHGPNPSLWTCLAVRKERGVRGKQWEGAERSLEEGERRRQGRRWAEGWQAGADSRLRPIRAHHHGHACSSGFPSAQALMGTTSWNTSGARERGHTDTISANSLLGLNLPTNCKKVFPTFYRQES